MLCSETTRAAPVLGVRRGVHHFKFSRDSESTGSCCMRLRSPKCPTVLMYRDGHRKVTQIKDSSFCVASFNVLHHLSCNVQTQLRKLVTAVSHGADEPCWTRTSGPGQKKTSQRCLMVLMYHAEHEKVAPTKICPTPVLNVCSTPLCARNNAEYLGDNIAYCCFPRMCPMVLMYHAGHENVTGNAVICSDKAARRAAPVLSTCNTRLCAHNNAECVREWFFGSCFRKGVRWC